MTTKIVKEHKRFENEEQLLAYLINELNKDEKTITFIKKRIAKFGFDSVKDLSFKDTFYKGAKEPVIIYCFKCKKDYKIAPTNFLSSKGRGCKSCQYKNISKISKEKGRNNFEEKFTNIHPFIKILSDYNGMLLPIDVECLICGHKWSSIPDRLLRGSRCPKCARKEKTLLDLERAEKRFWEKVFILHPNLDFSEFIYKGTKIKGKVKCKLCKHKWETTPSSLLSNKGCSNCAIIKNAILKKEYGKNRFEKDMPIVHSNIRVLSDYNGMRESINVECEKCKYIWETTPDRLLRGFGCSKCFTSKGNKCMYSYFDEKEIPYEIEYYLVKGRNPLRLDILVNINGIRIGIEYDGIQHFKPIKFSNSVSDEQMLENFKKQQERDNRKNKLCKEQNIILIRIKWNGSNKFEDIRKNVYDTLDKKLKKYII